MRRQALERLCSLVTRSQRETAATHHRPMSLVKSDIRTALIEVNSTSVRIADIRYQPIASAQRRSRCGTPVAG
jgi:hypothetical protein